MAAVLTFPTLLGLAGYLFFDSADKDQRQKKRVSRLKDRLSLAEIRDQANREFEVRLATLLQSFRASAPAGAEIWADGPLVNLRVVKGTKSKLEIEHDPEKKVWHLEIERSTDQVVMHKVYEAALVNGRFLVREVPKGMVCCPKAEAWMGFGTLTPTSS